MKMRDGFSDIMYCICLNLLCNFCSAKIVRVVFELSIRGGLGDESRGYLQSVFNCT